jgi:LmbE family N-acetylglucosaminyl deacetylase
MAIDRVLVVFAHPDDAEFGSSGTVAKWTRSGVTVEYVCVTDGSAGSNEPGTRREELAPLRRDEQLAACAVLGVEDCTFLGIPDGYVELTLDLRRAITREVRRFRPDVFMVPDPIRLWDPERRYINHTDHRTVGMACLAVVNPDAPTRPQFPELLDEGYEPFEIPQMWMPVWDDADTFVDITETIDAKVEALRCHKSQIGDNPVDDWIRARARQRGEAAGMEFAESFRTFKLKDDPVETEAEGAGVGESAPDGAGVGESAPESSR